MHDDMDLRGNVTIVVTDAEGRLVQRQDRPNRIVLAGRTLVAQHFAGVQGTPPGKVTHLAVGANATPTADDQTALLAERAPRRPITEVLYEPIQVVDGTTTSRMRVRLKAVFDFADANDPGVPLREAGVFTAATAGVMYNRVVFAPVTKTDAFQLTLQWDITF